MRSDTVTKGKQQAPHRSLFNALGLTEEEMNRPLVGIVCSYNEIVPGHMNLDKIANAVKQGVAMAGGTPIMFPAIAVCDGIAMGHIGMKYSLVTRDLIRQIGLKIRTLTKGIRNRFPRTNAIFFCRNGFCQYDTVAGLLVSANDRRYRPDIHPGSVFQLFYCCPAKIS